MDYFLAFIILVAVIYNALGRGDKIRNLEADKKALEDRLIHLTSENQRLRIEASANPHFSQYRNPWNPYANAFNFQQQAYANAQRQAGQSTFYNQHGFHTSQAPTLSEWRREFGFTALQSVTRDAINAAFRAKALKAHPDKGGNTDDMARLNKLKQQAYAEILS